MPREFRMYSKGEVHFVDPRIKKPISFAHITDLHLPPAEESWPDKYRHAISWWNQEFERPQDALPMLLDQVKAAGVDFVFFGGDNVDVYDAEAAQRIRDMCRQRQLPCYFVLGNHDPQDLETRYATHVNTPEQRADLVSKLCQHWEMPAASYAFDVGGIRFIVLDTPYVFAEGGFAAVYDDQQVQWLLDQLRYDGPIVVFYHVPFKTPENEARLLLSWNGVRGWAAENKNSSRVMAALGGCPNLLGTFVGHTHIRSEDRLGQRWQFVTAAACQGAWRYVRICDTPAPKSLRASGLPLVETDKGVFFP